MMTEFQMIGTPFDRAKSLFVGPEEGRMYPPLLPLIRELIDAHQSEIDALAVDVEGMKAYCEIRDSNMQPLLDANHKLNEEIAELKGALLIACDDMTIYDEDRLIQPREHVYLPQAYLDRAKQDRVLFKEAIANE